MTEWEKGECLHKEFTGLYSYDVSLVLGWAHCLDRGVLHHLARITHQ